MHPLLLAALLASPDASACGGFFCRGPAQPVDQAAERILFAVDEDAGEVEVHVQIAFEGTASEFAWVLPVPSDPELMLTAEEVFANLSPPTMPRWTLSREVEGTCGHPLGNEINIYEGLALEGDGMAPARDLDGDGVVVVDQGTLGPYETVEVRADDPEALLGFLRDEGYALPDDVASRLAPYVADDSVFVALRLRKGATVGDLEPIALRYAGTTPQIPLQLTAIAATPDMPLRVYVLGSARAVPDNYLHVRLNELAIDWLREASNYANLVADAADQAGGQAFVTEFAQPTDALRDTFVPEGGYVVDHLTGSDRVVADAVDALRVGRIPVLAGTLGALRRALRADLDAFDVWLDEEGITDLRYFQCARCFGPEGDAWRIDADALREDLATHWVPAMRHAEDLLRVHPVLTRLTSAMSAAEMTTDPSFVLNPDLPMVDRDHEATLVTFCGKRRYTLEKAPRVLKLSDGRELWLPEDYWRGPRSFDYGGWLGEAGVAAEVVEQTGPTGDPVPVQDLRADIDAALDARNQAVRACGCDPRGGTVPAWWLALGVVVGMRRRR